jgi:hypothetical protein
LRYIPNVLRLIHRHRGFFLWVALAALALRLFFFVYFPMVTDDSRVYADLATNWLQHGIYGQTQTGAQGIQIVPTDTRLPGYPAFLAAIFGLFGVGNLRAVLLTQILVDLGTCLVIADIARRMVSERASRIAFLLAGLCPFLANYTAAELTETLEVFFTALALDCAAAALDRMREGGREISGHWFWAATGLAIAACVLLRPDGGILLAAVLLYLVVAAPKGANDFVRASASLKRCPDTNLDASPDANPDANPDTNPDPNPRAVQAMPRAKVGIFRGSMVAAIFVSAIFVSAIIVAVFALAPLAPWTVRNFRTLHHFQPLAPRYANETDELVLRGFNRWVKTWMLDYVSVEEIYWNVAGDKIDPAKLPSRAFDDPTERDATLAVIADYNEDQDVTPELDARFGGLAAERIRAHPIRYYMVLPVLRIADMWLRPRTEILPPDPRWWEFNDDAKESAAAVGLGLLNLAYVAAALLALFWRDPHGSGIRWAGLLVGFILLRSVFLGTLENPEPRYTLEGYPAVIVLASACLARCSRPDQPA